MTPETTENPEPPVARTCYVVMCHTDAGGALRLAARVRELSPTSSVLLRHDRGPGYLSQHDAAEVGADVLASSTTAAWGDWRLVEALLEALAHARSTTDADWYVLVSGQDHPVRPLAAWEAELAGSGADARFEHVPLNPQDHDYTWRRWAPPKAPRLLARCCAAAWRAATPLVGRGVLAFPVRGTGEWTVGLRRSHRRHGPPPVPLVKGSLWMAVSRGAVDAVLVRHRTDPAVRGFFERTRIADEGYLQTLLHDTPGLVVQDAPTSYARFTPGGWSPVWLTPQEVGALRSSPAAFARKVAPGDPDGFVPAADALVAERLSAR